MITIEALAKRYGAFAPVERHEPHRPTGSHDGVLGPNGAGKSTTKRIVVGLTRPTAEGVTISGRSLVDLRPRRNGRRTITVAPRPAPTPAGATSAEATSAEATV
jgi:ABC-type multidrug transport system ATPase subunit